MNPTPESRDPHQEGTLNLAFFTEPHMGCQRLQRQVSQLPGAPVFVYGTLLAHTPDPDGRRGLVFPGLSWTLT